jgi:threonylcarbamoyladenosine tRNA methylthiotransferase MtaB
VRYAVLTFGCRVNQADSLRLTQELRRRGGVESAAGEADLVVVNSCSVTASADQGTRQTVRRVARVNPRARIVVTGCYATREPEAVAALPGVVRVVRNPHKDTLADALEDEGWLASAERYGEGDGPCGARLEPGAAGRTAFTLRVQTGCDQACSYCIIPATRGAGRSLPVAAVVAEVERIAAAGYREIVLAGVHLGSYGRDLAPAASLAALLRAIDRSRADALFRVSSLEPMDCPPAIVDVIAGSGGRFAPHFHLPLQHASDAVLSGMRRPYTLRDFRRLIASILERLPHASIGTDLIIGFPGETAEGFGELTGYLPGSGLSHLHVFPYSDRPGTAASMMAARRVPGPEVRARGLELRAIGAGLTRRFRESQLGAIRPALTIEDGSTAVTDNYLKVRLAAGCRRNERVRVRITGVEGGVSGEVVERPGAPHASGGRGAVSADA